MNQYSDAGCAATPQSIPAVTAASEDLSRACASLGKGVELLESRLQPLLSDVAGLSDNSKPPQYPSALAQDIQREAIFIRGMSDRIANLLARLEI